jgi:hypothetical protein
MKVKKMSEKSRELFCHKLKSSKLDIQTGNKPQLLLYLTMKHIKVKLDLQPSQTGFSLEF